MRQVTRKGLLSVAAAGGMLALTSGAAHADSDADGVTKHSPGVLSGNSVQVPVEVGVNACGNSVDVVGVLNPTFGNTCVNGSEDGGHGQGGSGAHAQGVAEGSPGVASGNEVQVPVDVPVNACGNSVDIVGLGNAAFGNECANGEEPATPPEGQPDVPSSEDPEELPPTSEQDPAPEPVAEEGTPDEGTGDQLAETGTGLPVGAVAPLGAGLLLGGVVLYRRAHARHG